VKPFCFVLMPFGTKPDESGKQIDFDIVYTSIIAPAIEAAALVPIRADEELLGGSIHKLMFERLMLCDYAIADLTTGNPNVFYELGIRHALRPSSTIIVFREGTRPPFDVAPLRGLGYDAQSPQPSVEALTRRLSKARDRHDDSPVFQFLDDLPRPEIGHDRAETFRDLVEHSRRIKDEMSHGQALGKLKGREALLEIQEALGTLDDVKSGLVVDLFLTFRSLEAYNEMLALYDRMPVPLQRARLVREQRAFALNRLKRFAEAEKILLDIIGEHGRSPETNALLGRVYKDQWDNAGRATGSIVARGLLKKAIETYLAGFEADWRIALPGINAVTLMEMLDPPDPRQAALLPVVRYAAQRRIAASGSSYWDHATLLELAILCRDEATAADHLVDAVAEIRRMRSIYAPRTTARNLGFIREKRQSRGEPYAWIAEIEAQLEIAAAELEKGE
jgi:MAP3K TRAFs-binding domain